MMREFPQRSLMWTLRLFGSRRLGAPAVYALCAAGALSLVSAAIAQPCEEWTLLGTGGPAERFGHAMAMDPETNRTIVFGGLGMDRNDLGDTWEWDGSAWHLRATTGPSPRVGATMAYVEHLGTFVLFGGRPWQTLTVYDDQWAWDGREWTEITPEIRPPARSHQVMVYDSIRQVLVLFGGIARDRFGDTWEWDGQVWRQVVPPQSPPGRSSPGMAFDPRRGVMVMYGGYELTSRMNDAWEWNGTLWRQIPSPAAPARSGHVMMYDSIAEATIAFSGRSDSELLTDTWKWDGVRWTEIAETGPVPRDYATAAFDTLRNRAVLFGGLNRDHLNDLWQWTYEYWITGQPEMAAVRRGDPAEFLVEDAGDRPHTYQWRRDGVPLLDGGRISGAGTARLRISNVGRSDAAEYDCVLAGGTCGDLISDTARLNVIAPLLIAAPTCPQGGRASISWDHTTPDQSIAIAFARGTGNIRIPGGYPCAGTRLGLNQDQIQILWQGDAGPNGARTIHGSLLPNACGAHLQLLDFDSCLTSNVVQLN